MRSYLFFLLFLPCSTATRDSLSVYVFLLDECRISQEMAPYLANLHQQYGHEIGFTGFFPNRATEEYAMYQFTKKYNIPFSVMLDHAKVFAKKWEATILPEVILYNESKRRIEYRGLINDLYAKPGKRRHHIKNHYLRAAIEDVCSGRRPKVAETKPVGCFINFQENAQY